MNLKIQTNQDIFELDSKLSLEQLFLKVLQRNFSQEFK